MSEKLAKTKDKIQIIELEFSNVVTINKTIQDKYHYISQLIKGYISY